MADKEVNPLPGGDSAETQVELSNVAFAMGEIGERREPSLIAANRPGLSGYMGVGWLPPRVTVAGDPPPWDVAEFRVLATEFDGPGAGTERVLDILMNLAMCTVPISNQIFGGMFPAVLEDWVREQMEGGRGGPG